MSVLTHLISLAFIASFVAGHLSLVTAGRLSHGNHSHTCKATPGSPAWPSEAAWAEFNQSVGGRLLQPAPPGAVCHPGQSTYDAEQCAVVTTAWRTYDFHSNDPISK